MGITLIEFRDAFRNEWQRVTQEFPDDIIDAYEKDSTWTDFMLSPNGFLYRVMENISDKKSLKLYFRREWNNYDCLYLSGDEYAEDDSGSSWEKSRIEVVIEHENIFNTISTEMGRLIHARSPLKVLITYAPYQADKGVNKNLFTIVNMLEDLWKKVDDSAHLIAEDSEYLIIIGDREGKIDKTKDIKWSWVQRGEVNPNPLQ